MWYTDQSTPGGLCLSHEPGDSLCGNYDCHNPINSLPEAGSYASIWRVIANNDVHSGCKDPLAEELGFSSYAELRDHAEEMLEATA